MTGPVSISQISASLNAAPIYERTGASKLVPWVRWLSALIKANPDPTSLNDAALIDSDPLLYAQMAVYAEMRDADIKKYLADERQAGWSIGHLVNAILTKRTAYSSKSFQL